jgi:hypothetical protein
VDVDRHSNNGVSRYSAVSRPVQNAVTRLPDKMAASHFSLHEFQ